MLSLIYDTETTGVYNWRLPPTDASQPDVVQLCAILADDDRIYTQVNLFVHSDTDIPEGAFNVHRIDRDMTARVGISRLRLCQMFSAMAEKADVLVGFNEDFDNSLMRTAMLREGGNGKIMNRPRYCAMKRSTDVCQIPHPNPRKPGEFKWPSLQEAYKIMVDPRGFDGAHDAYADVKATHEVYRVLRQQSK